MRKSAAMRLFLAALTVTGVLTSPAKASGDLLVAPTRVVIDGQRGSEVILNNVGDEEATYRISLELRRMTAEGQLADVSDDEANAIEKAAKEIIFYAPRRVTLPPGQPQAIRIGIRKPQGLPDGEYRAHMLFRAIPKARPIAQTVDAGKLSVELVPIYGVTIPIIVRSGNVQASAAISNPRIENENGVDFLAFHVDRTGNSSVYGDIEVKSSTTGERLFLAKGIAVYPELDEREFRLAISPETATRLKGSVKMSFRESAEAGGNLLAETTAVMN